MIIYKTKSLADSYECSACGTVFTLADLERTCQHPGLGKYTVAPTLDRCPFCDAECNYKTARIVRRDPPVERNKEIAGLLRWKYQLEQNMAEMDSRKIQQEGVGIIDTGDDQPLYEDNRADDSKAAGRRSQANIKQLNTVMELAKVEDTIRKREDIPPSPEHLPRSKTQNCMSGGVTIKPQVDWAMVDRLIADHGLPLPLEIVKEYM